RIEALEAPEERRVVRKGVLEVAVGRAVLLHQDLPVLLDDLRLDLSGLSVDQDLPVGLAREDPLASLDHALRAERIGLPRKTEGRLRPLARLQERRRRPGRLERVLRNPRVDRADEPPQRIRRVANT